MSSVSRLNLPSISDPSLLRCCFVSSLTLCGDFVDVGHGDVGGVVAVALIRLCEAVHMQQLPVGHLPVGIKYLLTFSDGPHADHLQTVLRGETESREEEGKKS